LGGDAAAGSGGGFSPSGASGGVGAGSGASGSSGTSQSTGDESQASTDLATMTIPEVVGIYGNQYQLQVDVSRLPRIEQYQQLLTADANTSIVDIPSDIKTVTYYVKTPDMVAAAAPAAGLDSLADPNAHSLGLVRREVDRAVTSAALTNGDTTRLENSGDLLAPEVVGIEFRYFDGIEWRLEWDSTVEKSLPLAIQILLAMTTTVPDGLTAAATASELPPNVRIYSMVVNLPAGGQPSDSSSSGGESSGTAGTTGGSQ
jgi:hypothetical protein